MRIAYFTPLNPIRSGISDFAEELLPYIAQNAEIEIFVDHFVPDNEQIRSSFCVHDIKEFERKELRERFDIAVFQVGNNYDIHKNIVSAFIKYGGVLELHDLALHHYLACQTIMNSKLDSYMNLLRYCHGRRGLSAACNYINGKSESLWETRPLEFPVNKHLIDIADAVIVHSDFARQMVTSINAIVPIAVIPLGSIDIVDDPGTYKSFCRKSLQIDENHNVFGSFGFATPTKRIVETIDALAQYKKNVNNNFTYYIVGKVVGIEIEKIIYENDLTDNVVITGFVNLDNFKLYMGACDICINLRFPTQGESSAVLHRMLGMGKPVLVTDVGSFSEYPNNVAYKIPHGKKEVAKIYEALSNWTDNRSTLCIREQAAKEYAAKSFSLDVVSVAYDLFLNNVVNGTIKPDLEDIFINRLMMAESHSSLSIESLMQPDEEVVMDIYEKEADHSTEVSLSDYLGEKANQLAEMGFELTYIDHFADQCQIFSAQTDM